MKASIRARIAPPSLPAPDVIPLEQCERSISLNRVATEAVAGDRQAMSALLARLHPRVVLYYRARLLATPVAPFADDLAHQCTLDAITRITEAPNVNTRIETLAYRLAAQRIAAIPPARDVDPSLTRPFRLTDDLREILVLRIAVGLSPEMTASTLGTTRADVLARQHRALRTYVVPGEY